MESLICGGPTQADLQGVEPGWWGGA